MMSPGEIRRVGVWALRAVGYRFGTAERGARLLAFAEATGGQALRLLRLGAADIETTARVATARTRLGPSGWVIAARCKCLLELGPPAVDLATCGAHAAGAGSVLIQDVFGFCMVGALCGLTADRALDALMVFSAADGSDEPLPLGRCGWIAADASGVRAGALTHDRARSLCRRAQLSDMDIAGAIDREGYLAIFASPRDAAAPPRFGVRALAPDDGPARSLDGAAQLERANASGISVPFEDFLNLYALERRCWAPTSEKSRAQAAF
jgi:hypothetical protein